MDILAKVKGWASQITDLGLTAVAMLVVLQVLFGGTAIPFFSGMDVVGNIIGIVSALGSEGLVGLVAVVVLWWAFNKK